MQTELSPTNTTYVTITSTPGPWEGGGGLCVPAFSCVPGVAERGDPPLLRRLSGAALSLLPTLGGAPAAGCDGRGGNLPDL